MMGLAPTEVGALSLYEYGALLHNWNVQHRTEGDEPVAAPNIEDMEREFAEIEASGLAHMVH